MNYYFLSDIHGNLPALELALKNIDKESTIIFLGDIVNYGPWSEECVQLIDTIDNKITIKGNHENYYLNPSLIKNNIVKKFYDHTIQKFYSNEKISSYDNFYKFRKYMCLHTINDKKIFKDTIITTDQNYIIGHSHHQFINKVNKFYIINPGSVGQNRANLNLISFCKYNLSNDTFKFFNIEYDVNILINEMKNLNYPKVCLDYYISKI